MARQIDAAVELVLPVCRSAGDSLERFIAELACNVEVDTWDPRADRVSLLTLHAAKGLEFRVVFMVGCEDGILPLHFGGVPWSTFPPARSNSGMRASPERTQAEERRLFFVGMTRARDRLYMTRAMKRTWRGRICEFGSSPFISDIDAALLESRIARGTGRKKPAQSEQLALFTIES